MKSKKICQAGYVACLSGKKNAYWSLVVKLRGERPLGRSRHRWVYDIKMDIKIDRMDWFSVG
jgi:hypothetical protein